MRTLTPMVRRLLPYYRPYGRKVALGLVFVVASSAAASVVPWLLGIAVDGMRSREPLRRVASPAVGMVVVALLAGAFRYWMRELINGVSRYIEHDLRNDLFRHLTILDAGFFGRIRTGELMARLTNDLGAVRMAVGPAIMYLTNTIVGGIFALAFMLRIDVTLTVLALLPMALLPAVIARMGRAIHDRFEAVQEHFGKLTTLAQENLAGVRVVRAYRQEEPEIERFRALSEEYVAKNMSLARLYGVMHPTTGLLAGLGAVVVLGVGGVLVLRGTISVGSFIAFGFYLGMLTWPLIALGWVTNLFQRGAASFTRLADILDAVPAIASAEATRALPPGGAGRAVEFRRVSFHYPTPPDRSPRWVLRDVSFAVPAGSTLGVVGATGSGKSALMDLIPRLYDPQQGEILVDGIPIRELDLAGLRAEIGYVPQESFLFGDTIAANLRYGGSTDEAARWAADVSQLDGTIRGFPSGYETLLGERGINLSGGQKQRAALARALASRPKIVLLDDSLSAVDTHTEAEILRSLRSALAGRTALVASHRISAIRGADWIIVLENGRVVEQGRHEDLFAAGGRYWSLLSRQQLEEAVESEQETLADRTS
ncbi:MAG: ABC transporter ATP-binding protein/permease [Gemmatimonadota bacterium]|nr:ABC transporter ATP-binding protein/permease [Gemmatimonadota bacterium]